MATVKCPLIEKGWKRGYYPTNGAMVVKLDGKSGGYAVNGLSLAEEGTEK